MVDSSGLIVDGVSVAISGLQPSTINHQPPLPLRMNVLIVAPALTTPGASQRVVAYAAGLSGRGFAVHLATLEGRSPGTLCLPGSGLAVARLCRRFPLDPGPLWRLRRLAAAFRPHVIHCQGCASGTYGFLAVRGAGGAKLIVSDCDEPISGWGSLTIPRLNQFVRLSSGDAQSQQERKAAPAIADGVPEFRTGNFNRQPLLTPLSIPATARVVGYAGRLVRGERVRDLVWAMQLLRQITENVYFVILGDGPERRNLQKLARHFGCDHLVRFLDPRDNLHEWLQTFDVFWAADACREENALLEAMSAGLPIVATDTPRHRELLIDGESGYLVKVGDSVGIAQFTDRILAEPQLSRRLGAAARQRARSHFSMEQIVAAYAALYDTIASRA